MSRDPREFLEKEDWIPRVERLGVRTNARESLARILYQEGEYDEAMLEARAVLKMDPKSGEAMLLLARIHYDRGEHDDAVTLAVQAAAVGSCRHQ